MNYLNVTYEQLLQDFRARLNSDPRFKNIGSATIYGMFQEMLCACMDMTNFYMQRTAEEGFISTARLDSSVIKHGKNLGYNPRRAVPARCELIIRLKGPLPEALVPGSEIFFNQEITDLSFNGNKYILDGSYSYVLTLDDITQGKSSDWFKELRFSVPVEKATYIPLAGISYYDTENTMPIGCFQGERRLVEFLGTANMDKIGETNQFYDINDLDFSNWYGDRDPYGFKNNKFDKLASWCKVGIGADEYDAFEKDNLYQIETQSIYLNEDVVNIKGNEPPETPLKVCLIDTNSDKTVRLSFSTEPKICDIGLKSTKDNIYVKYIATKGKECNITGVKGSIMSHSNQFTVTVNGSIVDVTNNIQFIINSDIYGGEYFESQNSIKINAPAYFSSCGKLITKHDFCSYFRGLTSPITVQNALVCGQMEIEDNLSSKVVHKLIQNNIFYCLMGHLYVKNGGNWTPRNLLTGTDDSNNSFTIYGADYLDHLCDFIKMLYSYEGYYNKIFNLPADEQWIKNARLIYENIKHKLEINSILMPMTPFLQYFDIVGTVYVDPLTDIAEYTNEMKNIVYEYLDQKAATERKIYKSEIIDLYNKHERTKAVDIDIKVSEIVKSNTMKFNWSGSFNSDFRILQETDLDSYKDSAMDPDGIVNQRLGWWNKIAISKIDQNGNPLTEELFKNRQIVYNIKFLNKHTSNNTSMTIQTISYVLKCDVSSDENQIYLYPTTVQPQGTTVSYRYMNTRSDYNPDTSTWNMSKLKNQAEQTDAKSATQDGIISLEIEVGSNDDYYSTSNLSTYNTEDYMTNRNKIKDVLDKLYKWLENLQADKHANRAIPLPYIIDIPVPINDSGKKAEDPKIVETRNENIIRKGNLITINEKTLSEQSFWNYFVPNFILTPIYSKTGDGRSAIDETTEYDANEWKAATKMIMDIYALIKVGICDSILDENNNIVNFSTDLELPILFNKINVKYKQN